MKALINLLFLLTLGVAIAAVALFFFGIEPVNWQMLSLTAIVPGVLFLILDVYQRGRPDEKV